MHRHPFQGKSVLQSLFLLQIVLLVPHPKEQIPPHQLFGAVQLFPYCIPVRKMFNYEGEGSETLGGPTTAGLR